MSSGQVLLFDGWWGWRRAQKIYFPILNFRGTFAGAKGLAGGLGGFGWQGGCSGNLVFNSKFPQPQSVRLGWVGRGAG